MLLSTLVDLGRYLPTFTRVFLSVGCYKYAPKCSCTQVPLESALQLHLLLNK